MKIGFYLWGDDSWHTGIVYLQGLFQALRETYSNDLSLFLLVVNPEQRIPDGLQNLVDEVIAIPSSRRGTRAWAVNRLMQRFIRRDVESDLYLIQHGVDVIALGDAPQGSKVPTLAWIPDFQHRHLPEMFSSQELEQRDQWYRGMTERSTRVLLLSESVKRDFEAFAPQFANKARVSSPASYIPSFIYEMDAQSVYNRYHLPEKFVYLPGQFWKHKNHRVVFRALKILKEKGIEIFLVCSGFPGDYRHPRYFADLLQELSSLDIRDQVAFLGLLPRDDVFQLMRQSVCVLNPSLFEGYGMTVDEARSLGKPVLISDISAHREQDPPQAIFFDPTIAEELASKLEIIWRDKLPGPDLELERNARAVQSERVKKYAESFLSIVKEVVNDK